jgi:thiamine pyrophosphokinase
LEAKDDIFPLSLKFPYKGQLENIFLLDQKNHTEVFQTSPGLTISLIPWLGPVQGVQTVGFKWNLSNIEINKDFKSLSNIAIGNFVKISIKSGLLLCLIQKTIIDKEMLDLVRA